MFNVKIILKNLFYELLVGTIKFSQHRQKERKWGGGERKSLPLCSKIEILTGLF